MQDADAIVAQSREQIAAYGLDVEEVRDAVVEYLLGDQILPIEPALHPRPLPSLLPPPNRPLRTLPQPSP